MSNRTSEHSGFYKLTPNERLDIVAEYAGLNPDEKAAILDTGSLNLDQANAMIENVIGTFELPLGVGLNFLINGVDRMVPMASEEPSVVAAASKIAKMARQCGGFKASSTEPVMIGQIQTIRVPDPFGAKMNILARKDDLVALANEQDPLLVKFGGGARDIEVRVLDSPGGPMVVTHLLVDCRDAMGANAVNTMAEAIAPVIEEITGGIVKLRILSNLAKHRLVRASVRISQEVMGSKDVIDGVISAYHFAVANPYRCATHNKGIMNGIDAVVLATGNDFRAIEAGAHSWAAINGYSPLTTWEKDRDGSLVGTIEMPMAVGLIGGAVKVHPTARAAVKILGVTHANELGEIIAAVGLAQNLGALRALATEGIQKGHMGLHAKNIVKSVAEQMQVTLSDSQSEQVVRTLVAEKKVRMDRAKEVIEELVKG